MFFRKNVRAIVGVQCNAVNSTNSGLSLFGGCGSGANFPNGQFASDR